MPKRILKFDFHECISSKAPLLDETDFLVLYKADKEDFLYWSHDIIEGYFEAAHRITHSLEGEIIGPPHDNLARPLLNLYIHITEFLLKLLINELIKHSEFKCCDEISILNIESKTFLNTHNLKKLLGIISQLIPSNRQVLCFNELKEISNFIVMLADYGINSETTRYLNVSQPKTLQTNQTWIHFQKLGDNIKITKKIILEYISANLVNPCPKK